MGTHMVEKTGIMNMQTTQQRSVPDIAFTIDANKQQRQLIAELENKNR